VKGDHPVTDDRKIPDNKIGRRKSDAPTMTDITDYTMPRYREAADIARKVMQGELPAEMLKVAPKLNAEATKYGREALKARRRSRLAEAPDGRRR
jgi:hypothetical protein